MKKSEAIEIARATHEVELNRANTHFSNVNKSKSVWWIEVPLRKLDDHETINLVVEKSGKVTLLQVPTKALFVAAFNFESCVCVGHCRYCDVQDISQQHRLLS